MGYGSRQSTQNETQVAEKYFLKRPAFLARERQPKTTLTFILPRCCQGCGEGSHTAPLLGVQTLVATVKIKGTMPQEVENRSTTRSSYTTPRYTPEELCPCLLLLYSQYAENGTSLEAQQLMDRENVVRLHNEILFSY